MIAHLANKIASNIYNSLDQETIQNNGLDKLSNFNQHELTNRFKVLIIYAIVFPILILIGLYYGIMINIIIATLSIIFLRLWNGGIHFEIPEACLTVTLFVITAIPLMDHYLHNFKFIFLIINIVIILYITFFKNTIIYKNLFLIIPCLATFNFTNIFMLAVIVQFVDWFISQIEGKKGS